MNDFEKNRVNFTIAFFVASYALFPLLKGINIYEPFIKTMYFFIVFNIFLGISIYLYAVSFFGIKTILKRTKKVADIIYRITIFMPLGYFLYYLISFLHYYFNSKKLSYISASGYSLFANDVFYNVILGVVIIVIFFVIGIIGIDIASLLDRNKKGIKTFRLKGRPSLAASGYVRQGTSNNNASPQGAQDAHIHSLGASTAKKKSFVSPAPGRRRS